MGKRSQNPFGRFIVSAVRSCRSGVRVWELKRLNSPSAKFTNHFFFVLCVSNNIPILTSINFERLHFNFGGLAHVMWLLECFCFSSIHSIRHSIDTCNYTPFELSTKIHSPRLFSSVAVIVVIIIIRPFNLRKLFRIRTLNSTMRA